MSERPIEVRYKGKSFRIGDLADLIKELPRKLRAPMLGFAANEYKEYFALYPQYKYVSRRRAYGNVSTDGAPPGYFSKRQFRYVMARIHDGTITPGVDNRTYAIKYGWKVEQKGVNVAIVNSEPGAVFLFDPVYQARQPALVGWQKIPDMAAEAEDYVVERTWTEVIRLADEMMENIMTGKK